jgi:hypothetical protein
MSMDHTLFGDKLKKRIIALADVELKARSGRSDVKIVQGVSALHVCDEKNTKLGDEYDIILNDLLKETFYQFLSSSLDEIGLISVVLEREIEEWECYLAKPLFELYRNSKIYCIFRYVDISQKDRAAFKNSKIVFATPYRLQGRYIYLSRLKESFAKNIISLNVPEFDENKLSCIAIIRVPSFLLKLLVKSNIKLLSALPRIIGKRGSRIQAISEELSGERLHIVDVEAADFVFQLFKPFKIFTILSNKDKLVVVLKRGTDFSKDGDYTELSLKNYNTTIRSYGVEVFRYYSFSRSQLILTTFFRNKDAEMELMKIIIENCAAATKKEVTVCLSREDV